MEPQRFVSVHLAGVLAAYSVWWLSLETGVLACPLNTFHCEPAVPAPRPVKMAFIHVSTVLRERSA